MKSLSVGLRIILVVGFLCTGIIVSMANAQCTLALQEKYAEGAKKFVSDITARFACSYHYNRKLDYCFIRIDYLREPVTVTLTNVFETVVSQRYVEKVL